MSARTKIQTNGNSDALGPTSSSDCAALVSQSPIFSAAIRSIVGKWKIEIMWQLIGGKQRFGELRRALPGITQHMLTTQLRELEGDALVKRTVFAEIPPRVEYELTEAALDLQPIFLGLIDWSVRHGKADAI